MPNEPCGQAAPACGDIPEIAQLLNSVHALEPGRGIEVIFTIFVLHSQKRAPEGSQLGITLADIREAIEEYKAGKDYLSITVFTEGMSFAVVDKTTMDAQIKEKMERGIESVSLNEPVAVGAIIGEPITEAEVREFIRSEPGSEAANEGGGYPPINDKGE